MGLHGVVMHCTCFEPQTGACDVVHATGFSPTRTLTVHKPLLVIELWNKAGNEENFKATVEQLEALGYASYQFGQNNRLISYRMGDRLLCPNMVFAHPLGRKPAGMVLQ